MDATNLSEIVKASNSEKRENLPLLLEADPLVEMIEKYLGQGDMFVCKSAGTVIGLVVVIPLSGNDCELKNISVLPQYQHKGIGRRLVGFVINHYRARFKNMYVGTSDSGVGFYQKCGFTVSHKVKGFFTENYPEPIIENGMQCVDMIYLKHEL